MKARRSLITLISVFFLALACAFGVMNFSKSNAMAAETVNAPVAGVDTILDAGAGLVLDTNADVRISGKAIKFSTTLTKEFHDELAAQGDVTYIATMNIVGDDNVLAMAFAAPEFEGATTKLEAYLNFDGASEAVLAQALTAEFETATYALVGDTYYKATNSNEVERSMRAVANSEYLNWTEGVGYEKSDLTDFGYFTIGYQSEKEYAVVDTNDKLYVHIPTAPAAQAAIYVDDVKVEATYDDATAKYVVENFATEANYVTVFTAEGAAYSAKIETGVTAIANLDELKAAFGKAGAIEGSYALIADIEVGVWTEYINEMYGSLNGVGYALTNYDNTSNATFNALFVNAYGATVKNLIMTSAANNQVNNNGGILFGNIKANVAATTDPESGVPIPEVIYDDTVIDNVIIFQQSAGYNSAPIYCTSHNTIIKDSIFITGHHNEVLKVGGALTFNNSSATGTIQAENTIVVTGANGVVAGDTNKVSGATSFKTMGELYNADVAGDVISDVQWAQLTKIKAFLPLDAENFASLETATSGIYVLMEDIDMTAHCYDGSAYAWTGPSFNGVLDGNGHSIYNVFTGAATANGFMIPAAGGMTVVNIGISANYFSGNHAGIFGRLNSGRLAVYNSALKTDKIANYGGSLLGYASQKGVYIKDSLLYIGNGGKAETSGWLLGFSNTTAAGNAALYNTYVINLSGAPYSKDGCVSTITTTANTDYFMYTDPADFCADEDVNLPAVVENVAASAGIITELNADTLALAKGATGGYWYLTDHLDVNGATGLFNFGGRYSNVYHGVNLYLDGRGHTLSGFVGNATGNTGVLVREGFGNVTVKNIKLEGSFNTVGSAANLFVGIFRDNTPNNKLILENVFLDIDGFKTNDPTSDKAGGILTSWSTSGTTISLNKVFINIANYEQGAILTGRLWNGTITFSDVFIVGAPVDAPLYHSAFTAKDAEGNTITPGGDGEFDLACAIEASLEDLKNDTWGSWDYILSDLTDLVALDPEFFA